MFSHEYCRQQDSANRDRDDDPGHIRRSDGGDTGSQEKWPVGCCAYGEHIEDLMLSLLKKSKLHMDRMYTIVGVRLLD